MCKQHFRCHTARQAGDVSEDSNGSTTFLLIDLFVVVLPLANTVRTPAFVFNQIGRDVRERLDEGVADRSTGAEVAEGSSRILKLTLTASMMSWIHRL